MGQIAIRQLFFILKPEFHPDQRMHFKWRLQGRLESLIQPAAQGNIQIHNANTLISHFNFSYFMFFENFILKNDGWKVLLYLLLCWLWLTTWPFYSEKILMKVFFNGIWRLALDMNHIWLLLCGSQSSSCLCCSLCTKGDGPEQSSRGENPCVGISLC